MHRGSIASWGDQSGEHSVFADPEDVNDDTTSGEPSDDDDGWDDLSADDDWYAPIIVCLHDGAHNLIAPEPVPLSPSIVPPSSALLISQRLRC
jgi:hypothetical protein